MDHELRDSPRGEGQASKLGMDLRAEGQTSRKGTDLGLGMDHELRDSPRGKGQTGQTPAVIIEPDLSELGIAPRISPSPKLPYIVNNCFLPNLLFIIQQEQHSAS